MTFDGVNDLVTIADAASLDLTTGMTIEAWVWSSLGTNWRTVLIKERPVGSPTLSTLRPTPAAPRFR